MWLKVGGRKAGAGIAVVEMSKGQVKTHHRQRWQNNIKWADGIFLSLGW